MPSKTAGIKMASIGVRMKLVQVQIFVVIGILLTLMHTILVSCEGGKYSTNSDIKTQTISGLPCSEKYITKPYFEKYDRLTDSNFQNFIANELPFGFCGVLQEKLNLVPRLPVLQRYLIGEGSHRRLSSSIRLSVQPESIAELHRHFCKIIIVEKLPSGVFADPFEIQHLIQCGVLTEAAVFGDTNLELPSVVSNRSVVEVHMDVGYNTLSGKNNGLEINIEIPVHARYLPIGERGFSRVEFGSPDIFMHCNMEGKSHDHGCLLTLTGSVTDTETAAVWEIPCGIEEHSGVVYAAYVYFSCSISFLNCIDIDL
ncbi:uncharacterized protein LOC130764291 isoform X2 [Actinidia eriantha]|uniref:uncharacterized protein LOC130764291 isoform X2 n=1 Tax=Actinidia eriantha TaxID=165200 RepID=UPI00258268EF|nr:uncharacterized protein LOC130764291 isoform X2 [Actinidia eriantha]